MREVNFSIPNVNKASVGITTALYDRRALDCTSTLPLINSLNHLAYLTTSSARIRDILTVDGGIERLVCILKQGRSKDMMGMWKWNLAFQCVVNIGVRGTENVRTRVVEADMVPVIATILDNYIKVIDRCREKADEAKQKQIHEHHHRHRSHDHRVSSRASGLFASRSSRNETEHRTIRRQALPPSIDITASYAGPSTAAPRQGTEASSALSPERPGTSDRAAVTPLRHRHSFRATEGQTTATHQAVQPLALTVPVMEAIDGFLRPVRDADRLASMTLIGQTELGSQPTSPTTPLPPPQLRSPTVLPTANIDEATPQRRRPSIRHQNSTAEVDDINNDSMPSDESPDAEMTGTGDMRSAVGIQDITMDDGEGMLATESLELTGATVSETQDTGAFNITHRSPIDGSIGSDVAPAPVPPIGLSPNRPSLVSPPQPHVPTSSVPRYLLDRHFVPNPQMLAVMPREEDVLMSLQLLAYVSKYCGLRSYFQNSHLVPRLAIGKDLAALDGGGDDEEIDDSVAVDEEYLLPNDFNLFPLVEKFTTTLVAAFDSAHTTNVEPGKSFHDNLRNVVDAVGQSTAARNVKKAPGPFTAIGVSQLLNDKVQHCLERFS
ncbi:MYND-type zinc finger protein MUB1 [Cordyceps javanica]|uniref:MYND-type zinc finger protein MUB1 n=1 Tax=Cordyceps javanica TaxID=43265 RepID=A0A545VBK7_9HYPO|nr:MYND-type zinc finger protein MUB1 [Cordyceps javanica]